MLELFIYAVITSAFGGVVMNDADIKKEPLIDVIEVNYQEKIGIVRLGDEVFLVKE